MSITFILSMSISMTVRHEVKLEYSLIKFNSITISFSITLTYRHIICIGLYSVWVT